MGRVKSKETVDVAVVGKLGVGKSSFVHVVRLKDENVAIATSNATSNMYCGESSFPPPKYNHPGIQDLILWDFPGYGGPNLTLDQYIKRLDLEKFEIFIILFSTRLGENDMRTANELHKRKKIVYLVRTKIDIDIENDKRVNPSSHSVENVLGVIRYDCERNLKQSGLPDIRVFLTSSYDTHITQDIDYLNEVLEGEVMFAVCCLRFLILLVQSALIIHLFYTENI